MAMLPLRSTPDRAQADEWALVLAAAGIDHRLEADADAWTLRVAAEDVRRAAETLAAYDAEARGAPAAAAQRFSFGTAAGTGIAAGALLLAFFGRTGPPAADSAWFERGAAVSGAILAGEWWRAVTALTLHVDPFHVAGNAVAIAVLLPPVVARLGPGLALALVTLAGAVANLAGAAAHGAEHAAVGASTAAFAAIGILAALRLLPAPAEAPTRWRPWVVLVASVVLLAMLGAGRGADVLGHALGLATGGAAGLVVGRTMPRPPGALAQSALVAITAAGVLRCWRLALASG
jgi:membrane associated rhomboid family serine protease